MKKMSLKDNSKKMRGDLAQQQDPADVKEELYLFLQERYGFSRKEMFAESEED